MLIEFFGGVGCLYVRGGGDGECWWIEELVGREGVSKKRCVKNRVCVM